MIKVVIEHDLGEFEEVNLGEITVGDIPAIKRALIGQMVYVDGGRRIYSTVLHGTGSEPVLAFQYGDEL